MGPRGKELDMRALGARLRAERRGRGATLERLAEASGVSRSMISEVERGTRTPTVAVLIKIATGLGTSLARLVEEPRSAQTVVMRHGEQPVMDNGSGWERRVLSPVVPGAEFEFLRLTLEAGAGIGPFPGHGPGSREYVAVERGRLQLTLDSEQVLLEAGDSIGYPGDRAHGFVNAGDVQCVYYVVMYLAEAASSVEFPDAVHG